MINYRREGKAYVLGKSEGMNASLFFYATIEDVLGQNDQYYSIVLELC